MLYDYILLALVLLLVYTICSHTGFRYVALTALERRLHILAESLRSSLEALKEEQAKAAAADKEALATYNAEVEKMTAAQKEEVSAVLNGR